MSDLPPFYDDDETPLESEPEKPKRKLTLDDGELAFEFEVEKPKKRPPSRLWRKTYIPVPLLLAISGLLVCSAVLLLSTSLVNGSLLCKITSLCVREPAAFPTFAPTLSHDPLPPLNAVRVQHVSSSNGQTTTQYDQTATPANYQMPRCDPNADYANHLMFTMEEGDNAELFLASPDGSGLCRLTKNLIEEKLSDWSPDRKHILFESDRSDQRGNDLYLMNFDGSNIVNLTQDQAADFGGVWSPDGTRIAFTSYRGSTGQIYIMNADGSNVQDVTPDALNAASPSWSPDAKQLAYMAGSNNDPNRFEIYTVDLSTKVSKRITVDLSTEYSPVWSPVSASQLLFYADAVSDLGKYEGTDVFLLDLKNGADPRRLTVGNDSVWPTWSPDGKHMAFISNYALHTVDMKTGLELILSTGNQVRWRPIWR